ncbi:metal-dependent hydrolase [archaeon]|jgi:inner membrane protein|nr:metal-dependent hydrolase [archaeon]MBT4416531.1 metal-dependent hydrolase [archaeon]
MMFVTHLFVGVVVGLLLKDYGWWFFVVFVLASVLPDIDAPKSKVGQSFGILSWFVGLLGHRGVFHSWLIPFVVFVLLYLFGYFSLGLAFFCGYLLHLVLDAMTLQGVKFFWPLGWQVKGFVRTGGFVEYFLLVCLALFLLYRLF